MSENTMNGVHSGRMLKTMLINLQKNTTSESKRRISFLNLLLPNRFIIECR